MRTYSKILLSLLAATIVGLAIHSLFFTSRPEYPIHIWDRETVSVVEVVPPTIGEWPAGPHGDSLKWKLWREGLWYTFDTISLLSTR